jgi:hypothetical protein
VRTRNGLGARTACADTRREAAQARRLIARARCRTLQSGKLRKHFLDELRGLCKVLLLLFNLQFKRGLGLCCKALLCRANLFFKLTHALPQRCILAGERVAGRGGSEGRGGSVGGAGCLVESSAQRIVFLADVAKLGGHFLAEVSQLRGGGALALLTVIELRLIRSVRQI